MANSVVFSDDEMEIDEDLGYAKSYAKLCRDWSFGLYSRGPFPFSPYVLVQEEVQDSRPHELDEMFPIIDPKEKPTTKLSCGNRNDGFDLEIIRVDPYGNIMLMLLLPFLGTLITGFLGRLSKSIASEEGKKLGLIDAVAPTEQLLKVSRQWALDIAGKRKPWIRFLHSIDKIGSLPEVHDIIQAARQHAKKTAKNMPQHQACLDVIEAGIIHGGYHGLIEVMNFEDSPLGVW